MLYITRQIVSAGLGHPQIKLYSQRQALTVLPSIAPSRGKEFEGIPRTVLTLKVSIL